MSLISAILFVKPIYVPTSQYFWSSKSDFCLHCKPVSPTVSNTNFCIILFYLPKFWSHRTTTKKSAFKVFLVLLLSSTHFEMLRSHQKFGFFLFSSTTWYRLSTKWCEMRLGQGTTSYEVMDKKLSKHFSLKNFTLRDP